MKSLKKAFWKNMRTIGKSAGLYGIAWASNGDTGGIMGGMSMMSAFIPLILIFVIFYFLLIHPERKKQKEHQGMIKNLKKGDNVVTAGGLYGTITKTKKDYVEVEVSQEIVLKIQRSSISHLRRKE